MNADRAPRAHAGTSPWRWRAAAVYVIMLAATVAVFFVIRAYGETLTAPETAAPSLASGRGGAGGEAMVHVLAALAAVILTGQLLAKVFAWVGQPAVIGEVLAGLLLGPSLLGRVAPSVAAVVLPDSVAPYLNVIAQFGVILYMFVVGLELNLSELGQRVSATLLTAHAGIVVPFALGAGLALGLYPRLSSRDVPFTSFALFIGVAMAITAFPVLARILSDRGMQRTRLGVMALGCAAVGDVTAWCLLAFVAAVAQSKLGSAFAATALTLAYIAFMILVARPLAARWLPRRERSERLGGALLLVALLLSSLATELIGIHAVFGAFLLGAIIPHDSHLARGMIRRLEELVTVLLLPAFFALTGLRMRIDLVAGLEQWLWCGLIVLLATVGKIGSTAATARLTGWDWRQSAGLGILMNTRGLMELIVLNVGLELGVISPAVFAMMVLMALATTIGTVPLLQMVIRPADWDALPRAAAQTACVDHV